MVNHLRRHLVGTWIRDEPVRTLGSYSCNGPGYFTSICGNEARLVGNVFFAGEHTDSFYMYQGFMEGACLSGIRAASEILGR